MEGKMSQEPDAAPAGPAPVTVDRKRVHSRRALITGVVGAGVGAAVAVVATAQPAYAEGENVTVGNVFTDATSSTGVETSSGFGLLGQTTDATGSGVFGIDSSTAGGIAVKGASDVGTGVQGSTVGNGQLGVAGLDNSSGGGTGVSGTSNSGTGVAGTSTSGTGVQAASSTGTALAVAGKVTFSRSGTATVAAAKKSVTITLAGVTTSSMILATLQQAAGKIAVASAVPGSGSFIIHLTAAPTSSVKVAYFIIG
jgi:hypothetical protein